MKHARPDYNRIQDPAQLIPDDEPVFLIRAKDKTAPRVVEFWAELAELHGADRSMTDAALVHANDMRWWQDRHGCQVPDMPSAAIAEAASAPVEFEVVPVGLVESAFREGMEADDDHPWIGSDFDKAWQGSEAKQALEAFKR